MAAKSATRVGRGPCPHCGTELWFKRSSGGKLTFTCDAEDCDSSGYAEPGSGREKAWLASITKPAKATSRTAAPAEPAKPAPAAKPARSAFDLASL